VVLGLVAAACGLVAAVVFMNYNTKPAVQTDEIWVAAKEILPGTIFVEEKKQAWQAEYFEKKIVDKTNPWLAEGRNIIRNLDDLKRNKVQRVVRKGDPIFKEDLTANLGLDIPAGMVAVGVRVSAAGVAGGFVLPNSKVDVLVLERGTGKGGRPRSTIVLRNLLVAAADQKSMRDEGQAQLSQTVTLAVTPKQAQTLALAESRGPMTLLLRRPEDAKESDDTTKTELEPVEELDTDRKEATGPGTPMEETVDVLVARQDIPRDQKIDNVDTYFEVKAFPKKLAPKTILDRKALENKTIKRPWTEGQIALPSMFEDDGAARVDVPAPVTPVVTPTAPAKKVDRHVLTISNGSQPAKVVIYNDGKATAPEDTPVVQPAPTPAPPAPGDKPAGN
jgi:pilus assembly protein CpaB